jgi:hypothetical protein
MIRIVVCADDEHAVASDLPCDEVEHLERRAVSPLEILEDDQQRTLRRVSCQELGEIPEQARLELGRIPARRRRGPGTIERREELDQVRGTAAGQQRQDGGLDGPQQRDHGVREDGVRNPRLDGIRPPDRDRESAFRRAIGDRARQPRLAHAALADDEHRSAFAGIGFGQCGAERLQLCGASDEWRW